MSTNAPVATPPTNTPMLIRHAAVLGAGIMGSRIAAHLANAGIPVLLLDMADTTQRNALAIRAIEALAKAKPAAFYDPAFASRIAPGNFEDDLPRLAHCDWVIEAVAESLTIKTALLEKVIPYLSPSAVLTTNTSGLPIAQIAARLPKHRDRFFGTHFFNPPRYMRLLEVIPTAESDLAVLASFAAFADRILGKQVVFAKDTPNFIANRIGIFVLFTAATLMLEQGLSIEEVDALTGTAIGWPRTGTFRLADLVGIDILAHVAANFPQGVMQTVFSGVLTEMVKRNWLGDKTEQGFYKKISRESDGSSERLVLDLKTFKYRPAIKPNLPSLQMVKNAATAAERIRVLLAQDPAKDKAAAFLWPFFTAMWNYAADRIGEVADDIAAIDQAMRAGFNWELGPFQIWDAAEVTFSADHPKILSTNAAPLLAAKQNGWYSDNGQSIFNPALQARKPLATTQGHVRVADLRRTHGVIRSNAGASLVDIGDNVACIELHSLKNTIGGDVLALVSSVLQPDSDTVRNFSAFVLSSDRENFSVGANLMQLLLAAQESEWEELNAVIHGFQQMTAAIKYCLRPVVVAPFGLTLGGGAEICLHAAKRQSHAEIYIGLVEAGVGLVPAGGGTKEMLLRAIDEASALTPLDIPARFAQSAEMHAALKCKAETIAMAKVSTSAMEARTLGLLAPSDRITMNRERLLLEAKEQAIAMTASNYMAPQPRTRIPAPGTSALAAMEMGIYLMHEAGYASEHDQKVARWVAYILAGGRVTPGTLVTEQYLLDLEREAFLSLCGERRTQERIAFTLKTGKPLRN